MDGFLTLNPQYRDRRAFLEKIKSKAVLESMESMDKYLSELDAGVFRKLMQKKYRHSKELRRAYKKIAKSESKGVERMAFKLLIGQKIRFSSIMQKLLFYREFLEERHLFENSRMDHHDEAADLLFRNAYLQEEVQKEAEMLIGKMELLDKIFYFLELRSVLSSEYTRCFVRSFEQATEAEYRNNFVFMKYRMMMLSCLPDAEFYSELSKLLVHSNSTEKIKLYRAAEGTVMPEKLVIFLLKECFSSRKEMERIYLTFLRLMGLFSLDYDFKLKVMYSWMRYFLHEKRTDMYLEMYNDVRKAKRLDREFLFYEAMANFLQGKCEYRGVADLVESQRDDNRVAMHTLKSILGVYL